MKTAPVVGLALAVALLLPACTSADVTPLGAKRAPRPENSRVEVFLGSGAPHDLVPLVSRVGTPPGRPIGRITVSGPVGTLWRDLLVRAKEEARELGGDGLRIDGGDNTYKVLKATVYAQ